MNDTPEVMSFKQAMAYLQVGEAKLREWLNRDPDDNPLPGIRTSEVNAKHSHVRFRRTWLDAWLDRECARQTGVAPLGAMRRAG